MKVTGFYSQCQADLKKPTNKNRKEVKSEADYCVSCLNQQAKHTSFILFSHMVALRSGKHIFSQGNPTLNIGECPGV